MTDDQIRRMQKKKWCDVDFQKHKAARQKWRREYMRNYRAKKKIKAIMPLMPGICKILRDKGVLKRLAGKMAA